MNGYRFWVERHRLTSWLEEQERRASALPDDARKQRVLEAEREFRTKLDALYSQVRLHFDRAQA